MQEPWQLFARQSVKAAKFSPEYLHTIKAQVQQLIPRPCLPSRLSKIPEVYCRKADWVAWGRERIQWRFWHSHTARTSLDPETQSAHAFRELFALWASVQHESECGWHTTRGAAGSVPPPRAVCQGCRQQMAGGLSAGKMLKVRQGKLW